MHQRQRADLRLKLLKGAQEQKRHKSCTDAADDDNAADAAAASDEHDAAESFPLHPSVA
jgi:hypothetical protein